MTGKGVVGTVDGQRVAVGNCALLDSLGIDPEALPERAEAAAARRPGRGVRRGRRHARQDSLGVADPIKESAAEALAALHDEGIRVVMLTGDNRTTAEAVGATARHR